MQISVIDTSMTGFTKVGEDFHIELSSFDQYVTGSEESRFKLSEVVQVTQSPANLNCFEFIVRSTSQTLDNKSDLAYASDHVFQGIDQALVIERRTPKLK